MSRFATFLTLVLLIWVVMHSYVFWRISSIPQVARSVSWWALSLVGLLLWLSYPVSRMLEGRIPEVLMLPLEYAAATWVGVLFLFLCTFVAADVLTLGGFLWQRHVGHIRLAAGGLALCLSAVALIQGHRDPVITEREVPLRGLPKDRDGTVVVAVSDIHLGALIRERWVQRMVHRINALNPDVVFAVGDVLDGDADRARHMAGSLRAVRAPLGVWGVLGNHDFYAGVPQSAQFFTAAGIGLLRDTSAPLAPGLWIAGIDDLTARAQFGVNESPVPKALENATNGAVIYLSHTPWRAEEAARYGAGLMISGHTHKGQIWPFTYLVRSRYPFIAGKYDVDGMTLLVGRGTATWGPRMRLWERGEILKITLRSPAGVEAQQ